MQADTPTSPFFIVSCGRSGTTLARTMLNQHPQIGIPLESLFITDYLRAQSRVPIERMKRLIVKEYEIQEWGITLTEADLAGCQTVPELIERAHKIYLSKQGKLYWGQKTPRFIRHGALIKEAFPEAKFIHVIRDPRAVVNSLINSDVHNSNAYYGAKRWMKDTTAGLALKEAFPDDVLEIRYSDLILQPANVLLVIMDFLGYPFSPDLLDYHSVGLEEYREYYNEIHRLLNQPPDPSRIDAWQDEITEADLETVEAICSPLMTRLGFQPMFEAPQLNTSYARRLKHQRLIGFAKQVMKPLKGMRPGFISGYLRRKLALGLFLEDFWEINY